MRRSRRSASWSSRRERGSTEAAAIGSDAVPLRRRAVLLLVAAFVLTRAPLAWLADHPERYGPRDTKVTGDAEVYAFWANALLGDRLEPYSEVRIEYPPAVLPFLAAPRLWEATAGTYREGFIVVMLGLDAAGLIGLVALASRGSFLGAWLWIVCVPLLGPLSLLRLDLIPAVATVWASERASRNGWWGAGAWLAAGALAKLYPVLLLPLAAMKASSSKKVVIGAASVVTLGLLLVAGVLRELGDAVIGYHSARGIHVESTWGLGLLVASRLGYRAEVAYSFGAYHVGAPSAALLENIATGLPVAAFAAGTWLGALLVPKGDAARLAAALFATLAGVMVGGTVLSPQFLLWLVALAAVGTALPTGRARAPLLLVAPAAALSQALYPFFYNDLLAAAPAALALLAARNGLLAAAAIGTWVALHRA